MPDWGKINFHEHPPKPWSELLPGLPEDAKELVGQLVQYSGGRRLRADLVRENSCLFRLSRIANIM
jgi:cyclin-dependent kinase